VRQIVANVETYQSGVEDFRIRRHFASCTAVDAAGASAFVVASLPFGASVLDLLPSCLDCTLELKAAGLMENAVDSAADLAVQSWMVEGSGAVADVVIQRKESSSEVLAVAVVVVVGEVMSQTRTEAEKTDHPWIAAADRAVDSEGAALVSSLVLASP